MTDLKSLADRINRLLDEKAGIGADIGDIYQEAKSAGYVPKVLRKVIALTRMDQSKRAEEETLQGLYEAELDGPTRKAVELAAQGATSREIEQATGIDHATVARSVALKRKHATKLETQGAVPAGGGEVSADVTTVSASPLANPDWPEMPAQLRRVPA
jgi:uncharacterized protein (UPF0335 family)